MSNKEPGYVYILTNPSFREDWVKIGKSSRPVEFSICGIIIGEHVTFNPTGLVVKVASDDSIEHDDRNYKLSPFVGTFIPEEHRNTSGAYQGSKYSLYNREVLYEIRK